MINNCLTDISVLGKCVKQGFFVFVSRWNLHSRYFKMPLTIFKLNWPISFTCYSDIFYTCRTAVLFWSSAGVAISSLLLAFSNLNILLPCVGFSGLVSGGFWPLFPSCTADLFGTRHFASIRGIMHISSSLGTGALSIGIAGTLYQHNLKQHGDLESICLGSDCFRYLTYPNTSNI